MITVDEVKNLIEQNLAGKFSDLKTDVRRVFITVQPQDLIETCRMVKEKLEIHHISTISGRDTTAHIEINYHFARPGVVVTVKTLTDRQSPAVRTINPMSWGTCRRSRIFFSLSRSSVPLILRDTPLSFAPGIITR